jgi:NHL repeat-containing protein
MRRWLWLGVLAVAAISLSGRALAVSGSNTITTLAGRSMFPGFAGDGGPATKALFGGSTGVAVDQRGNVYIADTAGYRIRKVNRAGTISTFACTGKEGFSGDGASARSARCRPVGIAVDRQRNVYFTDRENNRVRRISADGKITTIAGIGGRQALTGDGGPATKAHLAAPEGLAVTATGTVYIADAQNNRVRRITPGGTITTYAGTGTAGFSGDGGPATWAQVDLPYDVAVDAAGNVYIADLGNNRVRKVSPAGTITTIAGTGGSGYSGDGGPATAARVHPLALAVGIQGDLYVGGDARVRKISSAGTITTVAGTGKFGFSGDYGPAAKAKLYGVAGLAADARGNLYIVDSENRRIRKVWNGPAPKKPTATTRPRKSPKPGSRAVTGSCTRATAVKLAIKHAYGEPLGHPALGFICGRFTGPGSTAMAGIYHSGTCLPFQGFAVFHLVGGGWKEVLPLTDFGVLSIKAVGNDIKETAPVFRPGDFRCNPSGGERSRIWHWNGSRMVAGAWTK